jgi:ASPIC and UnbV
MKYEPGKAPANPILRADILGLSPPVEESSCRLLVSIQLAIGARVTLKTGQIVQFSEVRGGGSYFSQNDPRLHFGLGAEGKISEVEIRWTNGNVRGAKGYARP